MEWRGEERSGEERRRENETVRMETKRRYMIRIAIRKEMNRKIRKGEENRIVKKRRT